jgi:pimeloyl-ACP methyl ester carboxylesterase
MASIPTAARNAAEQVDRIVTLEVNGTRQRVRLCASRRGLPPLLVVQAGPGFPLLNEVAKFRERLDLERDFTVAYWDQRGCGESPHADAQGVSVRTQVDDVGAMMRWLAHLTGQRITVLAISLGATFALQAAARDSGSLKALVTVSIDTDLPAGDAGAWQFLQHAMARSGRPSHARSIAKLGPPPYLTPEPFQLRARLVTDLGGIENVKSFGAMMRGALYGMMRTYGVAGTLAALRNMNAVQRRLLPEMAHLDLFADWPRPGVPVYHVFGTDDALIPRSLVERVSGVAAQGDSVVVVPGARHMVHFDAPGSVRDVIMEAHRAS